MTCKHVAIVGAGAPGLVGAKELLQEGRAVTCFEKTESLGGVFKYRGEPNSVGVWESCRLTSPILCMLPFCSYNTPKQGCTKATTAHSHGTLN